MKMMKIMNCHAALRLIFSVFPNRKNPMINITASIPTPVLELPLNCVEMPMSMVPMNAAPFPNIS